MVVQGEKTHYVLIKDFNTFMYITLEIVKGNIFVVIFYEILEQWKYWNVMLKTALKLMGNKRLRCLKMVNMLNSKMMIEK